MNLDLTPRPQAAPRGRRILAHAGIELTNVLRNGEQTLLQPTDALGPQMDRDQKLTRMFDLEQALLQQLSGESDQTQGVALIAAAVTRDIEHPCNLTRRVENRRGADCCEHDFILRAALLFA